MLTFKILLTELIHEYTQNDQLSLMNTGILPQIIGRNPYINTSTAKQMCRTIHNAAARNSVRFSVCLSVSPSHSPHHSLCDSKLKEFWWFSESCKHILFIYFLYMILSERLKCDNTWFCWQIQLSVLPSWYHCGLEEGQSDKTDKNQENYRWSLS